MSESDKDERIANIDALTKQAIIERLREAEAERDALLQQIKIAHNTISAKGVLTTKDKLNSVRRRFHLLLKSYREVNNGHIQN